MECFGITPRNTSSSCEDYSLMQSWITDLLLVWALQKAVTVTIYDHENCSIKIQSALHQETKKIRQGKEAITEKD